MDSKPIITCHGDQNLFSQLRTGVIRGLPRESVEWKRAYGRPRRLNLEANFVPFNPDILPDDEDWCLPGRPFLHTYWLESDFDAYKSNWKEEITEWISVLKARNIPDWLIIVVINDENKVKTKILRTSVYDKVKNDFCSKQSDRCAMLVEPFKADSRTTESWATLFSRLRQLLIQSYNYNLGQFEDHMRAERERRTETGWNFCNYFLLQEELALMFEMLRLCEDALVQYDELDALFTQYVLNHVAGDSACWLNTFISQQHLTWDGLSLTQPINVEKRNLIKKAQATLLDFRVYLFSRQCALTHLLKKPWEVAQRGIPFMQNCIQELALLKVNMPTGAMASWGFISSLEILYSCDKSTNPSNREELNRHAAGLWDYARRKLYDIAEVCGLVCECESGVLGDDSEDGVVEEKVSQILEGASVRIQKWSTDSPVEKDPISRLKEALSSKMLFQKHYLELSELAMGTYKFIGRMRSARMIGGDLATFYMQQGLWQKAEGFLQDALKVYKQDGWDQLAERTSLDIAQCQRQTGDKRKLVKSCAYVAGSSYLPDEKRITLCKEMIALAEEFEDKPVYIRSEPALWVVDVQPENKSFIINTEVSVHFVLHSKLPFAISCDYISISAIFDPSSQACVPQTRQEAKKTLRRRHSSETSFTGIELYNLEKQSVDASTQELDMFEQFDYHKDKKTIIACGIAWHEGVIPGSKSCQVVNKQKDVVKEDDEFTLSAENVLLNPGDNNLVLTANFSEKGYYSLSQACVRLRGLEFLRSLLSYNSGFMVICDEATLDLLPEGSGPLIAGIPQSFKLTIHYGSYGVQEESELILHHSDRLSFQAEGLKNNVIKLPKGDPYETRTLKLEAFCHLSNINDTVTIIKEEVSVELPSLNQLVSFEIAFQNPIQISQSLHSAGKRTFIRVVVAGTVREEKFSLFQPSLQVGDNKDVNSSEGSTTEDLDKSNISVACLNKQHQQLTITPDQSGSYVWRVVGSVPGSVPLSCVFSVQYTNGGVHSQNHQLHTTFTCNS